MVGGAYENENAAAAAMFPMRGPTDMVMDPAVPAPGGLRATMTVELQETRVIFTPPSRTTVWLQSVPNFVPGLMKGADKERKAGGGEGGGYVEACRRVTEARTRERHDGRGRGRGGEW
jgi:hypothetical protein